MSCDATVSLARALLWGALTGVLPSCAVGEPLEEDAIAAAAAQDGLSVSGDDDDGTLDGTPGPMDPSDGSGGSGEPVGTGPGDGSGTEATSGGVPTLPGDGSGAMPGGGGAGSMPMSGGSTSGTRLVPVAPTVPPEMTASGGSGGAMLGLGGAGVGVTGGAGGMLAVGGMGGSLAMGGMSSSNAATPEQIEASDVVVLYTAQQNMPMGRIFAMIRFQNRNTAEPVPVDQLVLRYWYTSEGLPLMFQNFHNGMAISGTSAAVGMDQGNEYIEVSFMGTNLSADVNANETQLTFDGTYNQEDDWSFDPDLDNEANARITLYRSGELIWGDEPPAAE